ncbi:MAG: Helicase-like protein [uncultured bacterium]|nr:MAG: Helicase-like protein [uncultured bacterium]HBY73692.1 hypothetical protein [Candidatus Kerfeldbacteria bacterium]
MARKLGETSYKQTAFGIIPRSKLIPLEIEGIKRAWDFVLERTAGGKILITPATLQQVHEIGFGWIFPEMGGKFRMIDVTVSSHKPPSYYEIPELMKNFCDDVETRIKHLPKIKEQNYLEGLIELLAWTHHRFLWIHPFQDYNGRIGRLLINIILLDLALPAIELKVETIAHRKRYIKALQTADQGNLILLEGMIEQALQEAGEAI